MGEKIRVGDGRLKLEWKEIYSVGNLELDEDHKKIFNCINKIEDNLYNRNSKFFEEIINELKEYSLIHFKKEEAHMRLIQFERIEEHILEHKIFTQKILEIEKKSLDFVLLNNISDFIKERIIAHILGSDKEYQKFLQHSECSE